MSRADEIFAQNMQDIMENGFWDTDLNVRPKWEDGTPARLVELDGKGERNRLEGDKISFWIDSEQVEVENSRITVEAGGKLKL